MGRPVGYGHPTLHSGRESLPVLQCAPEDIDQRYVFILDPMLATGGSAIETIRQLKKRGVAEDKIIFINLVSAPEGIDAVLTSFPGIRIITAEVDEGLNERAYIIPGLGDFGDIYFGTD